MLSEWQELQYKGNNFQGDPDLNLWNVTQNLNRLYLICCPNLTFGCRAGVLVHGVESLFIGKVIWRGLCKYNLVIA